MATRSRELRVVISGDATNLNKAFNQAGRDAEQAQGKVHKFGLNVGSAFKAAGAAIAASAVVDQIKESVKAAEAAQVAQTKLATQLKAVGITYGAHAKQITEVIDKTSALSGISGKDLEGALTSVVRGTGSLKDGLQGVAIAADLARAKHMDVAKAGDLVAKVYEGNVGALKRMGIALTPVTTAQDKLKESTKKATVEQTRAAKEADKTATAHKALGLLQQRVGGQAEAYGKTAAGAQDRFRVAVEHLHEKIGGALLPVLTQVADKAAKFVDQLTSGTGAGGRFAAKLKDVADAVKPIVKFFTDHPKLIALAVGAWGAYKAAGVAAATITRGKIIASFLGLGPKAAVGGAEAGAAFGEAEATAANTTMSTGTATGLRGLVGRMPMFGRMLGGALGTAMMYEVAKGFQGPTWAKILRGILPFQPTPGAPDVKPYKPSPGTKVILGPHGGVVAQTPTTPLPPHHTPTQGPTPAPHPGTRAHGAVAHTSSVHSAVVAHAARAATGGAPLAGGLGRTLSAAQIGALWLSAGGDPGATDVAVAVALAESGGRTDASNVNTNGSVDRGVWQINSVHGALSTFDPQANAAAAVQISGNGRNWNPWTTYGSGAYKKFLGRGGGANRTSISGLSGPSGGGGSPTRSAPTGADYARHAAHRVAPITHAFDHASGIYGGIAARASSSVDELSHDIGISQRMTDRRPVDLNTVTGRMQRTFDLASTRRIQAMKLAAQRREVTAKKRQITLKRQEITRLTVAMRRGSKHQRPAIRAKIHGLQRDIATLKSDIRQLGFDIDDSLQDVADTDADIATVQAGPQDKPDRLTGTAAIPGADEYMSVLNRDAALAALTPGTADDLDVATRLQSADAAILAYEQARPGQFTPDDVAQAATNLKSANDAVTQLSGTSDSQAASDLKAALDANTAELKRQNDFAKQVTSVSLGQAWTAIADQISGQITGTGYDPRAMTAGAGALARY